MGYSYYVLVAACVFAQEADLIRKACLAAALLFPAVAAIHGIVLAATHVDGQVLLYRPRPDSATSNIRLSLGAVDMDVFGAFQLCAIGVLAAPVNVRLSKKYFNDPGRNAIFGWSALLLAGKYRSLVIHPHHASLPLIAAFRTAKLDGRVLSSGRITVSS